MTSPSGPVPAILAIRRGPTEFIVEIRYREPSYEAREGERDEPFRFRYRIYAGTADAATSLALDEFRRITKLSSVGWIRDVVSVDVIPVLPDWSGDVS